MGFGVWGLGFWAQGLGFRVQGSGGPPAGLFVRAACRSLRSKTLSRACCLGVKGLDFWGFLRKHIHLMYDIIDTLSLNIFGA